jgi:hypothetical protein
MRVTSAFVAIASLVSAIACGGSDSKGVTNPNPNSAGTMSARIDGAAWTAVAVSVGANTNGLIISGANSSGTPIAVAIGMSRALGTGTQTFGSNANALGTLTVGTGSWSATGLQGIGGSGSVTLTTLTSNRAAGSFAFNAAPLAGGATGTKVVTVGVFDVKF